MGDKEKLSYRPGMVLQGVYKSYGPRFGFLITDEDHEDVYIADRDHLNAVNNDIVEFEQNGEDRAAYGEQLLKKLEQRLKTKA